ncbi:PIR protein [Plasmodium vivax]|nr:PIR protein [Plasmodium vivax]
MYSGDLKIKRIPLKVFYDKDIVDINDKLPSEKLNNFNKSKFFHSSHKFDENSIRILNSYPSLKCPRNLYTYEDKNLYVKKIMYDLFDDIEYMLSDDKILSGEQCSKMVDRIKYRWGILTDIYVAVSDKNIFTLDNNFTFSIIGEKLQGLSCKKTSELSQTVAVAEPQPLTDTPNSEGDLLETEVREDEEDLESLSDGFGLNEDSHTEPKLDTTYAAASLAGISLFGTILYKYGPFRNRLISRRGGINGSNIFPLDNNVYDANIMNNFEYLQTGIPNDEYQVGYGSVTDY